MPKTSAGILMYKFKDNKIEFFLVHPGGPFWKNKDEGVWSIPKGEIEGDEELIERAKKELFEETGIKIPYGAEFIELGKIKQKSGKIVYAFAFEDKFNLWNGMFLRQSFIKIEYPFKSGKFIQIPEVDKAGYFSEEVAIRKMIREQSEFIFRLKKILTE